MFRAKNPVIHSFGPSHEEKERINNAATKLNTVVPPTISGIFWSLPIIESLIERVIALEKQINTKKRRYSNGL